jgi:hypothetical protein
MTEAPPMARKSRKITYEKVVIHCIIFQCTSQKLLSIDVKLAPTQ